MQAIFCDAVPRHGRTKSWKRWSYVRPCRTAFTLNSFPTDSIFVLLVFYVSCSLYRPSLQPLIRHFQSSRCCCCTFVKRSRHWSPAFEVLYSNFPSFEILWPFFELLEMEDTPQTWFKHWQHTNRSPWTDCSRFDRHCPPIRSGPAACNSRLTNAPMIQHKSNRETPTGGQRFHVARLTSALNKWTTPKRLCTGFR